MEEKVIENSNHREVFTNTGNYADKDFWNDRFEKSKGSFDWYIGWNELKPNVEHLINKESKILIVGCGNSKMSELMYNHGFKSITNIDISNVVVEKMNNQYKKQGKFENMEFLEMDATNMTFADNTFNFIIDKGTLDALMCAKNMDIPLKLIREMARVTKLNSHFIIITYGNPDERLNLFLEAIPEKNYHLDYKKVSLSLMSNLINILRNNSSDFTVSNAIKDKNVLVNSIMEACLTKLQQEKKEIMNPDQGSSETPEEDKDKLDKINSKIDQINKKIFQMKLVRMIYKNKLKREEKVERENNLISQDTIEEKPVNKVDNEEESGVRRSHCYLYIFKKLSV